MSYQIASGYNNAAGLSELSTQPRSTDIRPGRVRTNGHGIQVADGFLSQDWEFSIITPDQIDNLMADLGIDVDDFVPMSLERTVRTRLNSNRSFANFNAIVSIPSVADFSVLGSENFTVRLTRMEAI